MQRFMRGFPFNSFSSAESCCSTPSLSSLLKSYSLSFMAAWMTCASHTSENHLQLAKAIGRPSCKHYSESPAVLWEFGPTAQHKPQRLQALVKHLHEDDGRIAAQHAARCTMKTKATAHVTETRVATAQSTKLSQPSL